MIPQKSNNMLSNVRDPVSKILNEPSLQNRNLATQLLGILLKHGLAGVAIIGLTYYVWHKDAVIKSKDDKSEATHALVLGLVREQTQATVQQTAALDNLGKNIESLGKNIDANTRKLEDIERRNGR